MNTQAGRSRAAPEDSCGCAALPHTALVFMCALSRPLEHLFLRAFWQTMIREWVGIDRLRLDKFYMVRHRAGGPRALG